MVVRRVVGIAVAVSVLVPSAAAAQAKKVAVIKIDGGASGVTLDPAATGALQGLGVSTQAISGTRSDDDGATVFRVTSGSLAGNKPEKGIIYHRGGLRLLQGASGIKVDLNNPRINDGAPARLTVRINDAAERIALARLDLSDAEIGGSKRQLALGDVALLLTADGAAALNTAFSTTVFAKNQPLGSLTTVARYRLKIKPAK